MKTAIRMECKELAQRVRECVKHNLLEYTERGLIQPYMAIVTIGDDPASKTYVQNKIKACQEVGIKGIHFKLDKDVSEQDAEKLIEELNGDECVHGIILQLPLPKGFDEHYLTNLISPIKDIDGFTIHNQGLLHTNQYSAIPCTPKGIIEILDSFGIEIAGKQVAVVGRSNIVGKPIATLLTDRNATVTLCHSKTTDLFHYTRNADIVISAIGSPYFFSNASFFKRGATIIDVGINRDSEGRLCGDVLITDTLERRVGAYTPVPGGVGVMTVAMLIENLFEAYKKQVNK